MSTPASLPQRMDPLVGLMVSFIVGERMRAFAVSMVLLDVAALAFWGRVLITGSLPTPQQE